MRNNQKGITLVALVITIIVLLILAGITIAALSGDNGILTNAARARQETAIGEAKDMVALAVYEATNAWYEYKYLDGNNVTSGGTVGATQQETAISFIEGAADKVSTATITIVEGAADAQYVQIKSNDNDPKYVYSEITAEGGLSGWTDGQAPTA